MISSRVLVCAWLLAIAPACGGALAGKSDPVIPRYFTPEPTAQRQVTLTSAGQPPPAGSALTLRLGRVTSASHLRERIVYRSGDQEIAYYDEQRWTERPEAFVRRAFERELFEGRELCHAVSGSAPTLEVELVAFEEVRRPRAVARVQLHVALLDDRIAVYEQTVVIERPLDASGESAPDRVVRALADALGVAVDQVAHRVEAALAARPRPSKCERPTTGSP